MSIRIVRNDTGNCINFVGSTQPAYWNACLSAEVDAEDSLRINIINDIRTVEVGETVYEFYKMSFTDFVDAEGNAFSDATACAAYITEKANVVGNADGLLANENTQIDFQRDATNTTVLLDTGDAYAVNSIKAVEIDGLIDITEFSDNGATLIRELRHENVAITGSSPGVTVAAVVNALNALFTVTPLGAGSQPTSSILPTLPGVSTTGNLAEQTTPTTEKSPGVPHLAVTGSDTTTGHGARFWSNETVDQAGEYFTVRMTGGGRFILGLVETSSSDYLALSSDSGNSDSGLFWGNGFYDYGSYTAPWTTYGSSSGYAPGPGSTSSDTTEMMRYNDNVQAHFQSVTALGALFKVGINEDGYIAVYYYDEGRSNNWIMTARRSTSTPAGNYALVVKMWDQNSTLVEYPEVSLFDEATPTLTYYYVESPDGVFNYPLFQTAEEAEYYDTENGGAGSSQQIVFVDDSTPGRVWYAPATGYTDDGTAAPTNTTEITWNAVSTLADNLFAPPDLTLNNQTAAENTNVNIQIAPQDTVTTVSGLPSGLQYGAGFITGTTPYVAYDEEYTVTVSRSNAYGINNQTFTFTVTDNPSLGDITGFTEFGGNLVQPNRIIATNDALLQYDTVLSQGQQMTYTHNVQSPPSIGILSSVGEANLASFDASTDTLDTVGTSAAPGYDFQWRTQWDLRYITFSGNIGSNSNESFLLTGWADNTAQAGNSGDNYDIEFKLEYANDGYIRLYRGGVLKLTSASTFTGDQDIYFFVAGTGSSGSYFIPSDLAITNIGAGTTTPPTGFVDPVESGEMGGLTLFGNDTDGAVFLSSTLKVNHRYIVPQTWIEANVLPNIAGANAGSSTEYFFFGVPKDTADFSTINELNNYHASFRLGGGATSHSSRIYVNGTGGTSDSLVSIASATDAFYDYAIEWDGTDLHVIACNIGDINTQPGISGGGSFSRTVTLPDFATDHGKTNTELNLVIAVKDGAQVNLTTAGLQQIRIPFSTNTILTGESSGGNGQFGQVQSTYFDSGTQHAPSVLNYNHPTINAGYTYTYVYHPSMEAGDYIEFRLASDNTTVYTTGITAFDNTTAGDPSYSANEGYKGLTFVVPADVPPLVVYHYNQYQSGSFDSGREVPISGSTYTVTITGITLEGPAANQTGTNVMDQYDHGWISVDEQLSAGERLVLDNAFFTDFLAEVMDTNNIFAIGLKGGNWTNTKEVNNQQAATSGEFFKGNSYIVGVCSSDGTQVTMTIISNGSVGNSMLINTASLQQTVCAFIDITSSGNNIRMGFGRNGDLGVTQGDESTVAYANWNAYKGQTGDQGYGITSLDVVISFWTFDGGAIDGDQIDWTGLSEISVPTPSSPLTTSWTKALDFSGSSERTQQVTNDNNRCPLRMSGVNNNAAPPATAGNTSNDSNARPWATAVVFNFDGNPSNQHIWNCGEGAGAGDDNIYLRVDATGNLYFGWGRTGTNLNECAIGSFSSGTWYGIYIASNGTRLSNSTAAEIAAAFDIRNVDLSTGALSSNLSNTTNWTAGSFGARMNRQFTGEMTIAGRGANRNFHGKVAAMVVTTLRRNVAMPTDAEISMMIRDPEQWMTDYKVGNDFRLPWQGTDAGLNWARNDGSSSYSTQVWLMGDGTGDAYAQIRNQVWPSTQNFTPMNMISMVSNDIQTVNIPGLT